LLVFLSGKRIFQKLKQTSQESWELIWKSRASNVGWTATPATRGVGEGCQSAGQGLVKWNENVERTKTRKGVDGNLEG
jgi:hypothetical protein